MVPTVLKPESEARSPESESGSLTESVLYSLSVEQLQEVSLVDISHFSLGFSHTRLSETLNSNYAGINSQVHMRKRTVVTCVFVLLYCHRTVNALYCQT